MKKTNTDILVSTIRTACLAYKIQDELTSEMIDNAPNVDEEEFDRELDTLDSLRDTLVGLIETVPGIDHHTAEKMVRCLPYREKLYRLCGLA